MLARAAASDPTASVEFVRLAPDWRTLPFTTATFDAVVASSVLEYVHSPGEVLRECARVLRPGRRDAVHRPRPGAPGALAGMAGQVGRPDTGDAWPGQ